jgi:putative mRNA 3-end processing factor
VVDSTYGSPDARREFSQGEVETRLLELIYRLLKRGPVDLIAHRGTLQRALQVLNGQIDCPVVGSSFVHSEVAIYRECGYCIDEITVVGSEQAKHALCHGRYLRVYGKGDRVPTDRGRSSRITLSAFMTRSDDPVLEYSDVAYRVALSDHADFEGTLDYVQATGAKFVVTDNTRGGNGVRLALEIQNRLGTPARPSSNKASREWGA